mmetsp:Transcript_52204/g.77957  ORF Transcript_52204/g.77957 Transcript_52204/m.77957 type:complete len:225 (-) Transcript_52204:144-818(-)|eukprot:CAMPEP_0194048660 /NCGR_PEP_ID=MMETSP0009_2-20130614/28050_1 /TAXON_ID=210454 /ORGANISM="Grammatophora oceanica, Strain CCMP 410" /LENGTH=224 /DNA_ID=CAMNT_0038694591 /DNA_START=120 /DNA_END=794 /DNA_ORIENTATION=+
MRVKTVLLPAPLLLLACLVSLSDAFQPPQQRPRAGPAFTTTTTLMASSSSSLRIVDRTKQALIGSRSSSSSHTDSIHGRLGHALRPRRLSSASSSYAVQEREATRTLTSLKAEKNTAVSSKKFRTFEEMLQLYQDSPILVSFEAHWCGPCRLMKKELGEVSQEFGDAIQMFSIDTERWPKLGQRYQVSGLPTVLMFCGDSGEPLHRIEGVEKAEEIIQKIREVL